MPPTIPTNKGVILLQTLKQKIFCVCEILVTLFPPQFTKKEAHHSPANEHPGGQFLAAWERCDILQKAESTQHRRRCRLSLQEQSFFNIPNLKKRTMSEDTAHKTVKWSMVDFVRVVSQSANDLRLWQVVELLHMEVKLVPNVLQVLCKNKGSPRTEVGPEIKAKYFQKNYKESVTNFGPKKLQKSTFWPNSGHRAVWFTQGKQDLFEIPVTSCANWTELCKISQELPCVKILARKIL